MIRFDQTEIDLRASYAYEMHCFEIMVHSSKYLNQFGRTELSKILKNGKNKKFDFDRLNRIESM